MNVHEKQFLCLSSYSIIFTCRTTCLAFSNIAVQITMIHLKRTTYIARQKTDNRYILKAYSGILSSTPGQMSSLIHLISTKQQLSNNQKSMLQHLAPRINDRESNPNKYRGNHDRNNIKVEISNLAIYKHPGGGIWL